MSTYKIIKGFLHQEEIDILEKHFTHIIDNNRANIGQNGTFEFNVAPDVFKNEKWNLIPLWHDDQTQYYHYLFKKIEHRLSAHFNIDRNKLVQLHAMVFGPGSYVPAHCDRIWQRTDVLEDYPQTTSPEYHTERVQIRFGIYMNKGDDNFLWFNNEDNVVDLKVGDLVYFDSLDIVHGIKVNKTNSIPVCTIWTYIGPKDESIMHNTY